MSEINPTVLQVLQENEGNRMTASVIGGLANQIQNILHTLVNNAYQQGHNAGVQHNREGGTFLYPELLQASQEAPAVDHGTQPAQAANDPGQVTDLEPRPAPTKATRKPRSKPR